MIENSQMEILRSRRLFKYEVSLAFSDEGCWVGSWLAKQRLPHLLARVPEHASPDSTARVKRADLGSHLHFMGRDDRLMTMI